MAYEIEDIKYSQQIFYQLLKDTQLKETEQELLYRAYTENEMVQNLVKSQAEASDCDVERYGDVIYLLPREENTFLGFSKKQLKNILCKSNATDKDFYLSQFVILTLLVEFYDGQGVTSKAREYLRVGVLQNILSERLEAGVKNYTEDEEAQKGIAFRNMLEAYEALKSDEKGSRAKTTKEGFLHSILIFLENQGLIEYVQEDETIKTTRKLDHLMDYNILNKNNYQRVRKVLQHEQDECSSND